MNFFRGFSISRSFIGSSVFNTKNSFNLKFQQRQIVSTKPAFLLSTKGFFSPSSTTKIILPPQTLITSPLKTFRYNGYGKRFMATDNFPVDKYDPKNPKALSNDLDIDPDLNAGPDPYPGINPYSALGQLMLALLTLIVLTYLGSYFEDYEYDAVCFFLFLKNIKTS